MQPRAVVIALVAAVVFSSYGSAFCQEPQAAAPMDKAQVISVATEAVKASGLDIEGANIVYDQDGQLWSETIGKATMENVPNEGVFQHGNSANEEVVYFDYKEPLKDVWVFVDRDTGEVTEVYQEE